MPLRLYAPLALLYAAQAILFFPFTADDAFIVARYAANAADRGELVFNAGERISALTSPLQALLLTLLHAAFGESLRPYKALMVVLAPAAIVVLARAIPEPRRRVLFVAVALTSPLLVMWTAGGLETPLLAAALCVLVSAVVRLDAAPSTGRAAAVSVAAGICLLARFDAVLFVGPLLLFAGWRAARSAGRPLRLLAHLALPATLLVGAWLLFSLMYYGDPLPVSAYVKRPAVRAVIASPVRLVELAMYALNFLVLTWVALLPAVLGWRRVSSAAGPPARRVALGIAVSLAIAAPYLCLVGTQIHMMFGYRAPIPYLPLFAFALVSLRDGAAPRWPWFAAIIVLQATLAIAVYAKTLNPAVVSWGLREGTHPEYAHQSLAGYSREFEAALRAQAAAIETHWRAQRESARRPPRILTFAEGVLPYEYRDSYVFGTLVSYRRECRPDLNPSADYIHILAPRHGRSREQLKTVGSAVPVTARAFPFDGRTEFSEVYFNPSPRPNPLPSRIGQPCVSSAQHPY